eukprot:1184916-Prorocentrum_minimum.AAC.1
MIKCAARRPQEAFLRQRSLPAVRFLQPSTGVGRTVVCAAVGRVLECKVQGCSGCYGSGFFRKSLSYALVTTSLACPQRAGVFQSIPRGLAGKALSARPTSSPQHNFPTAPSHCATVGFPMQSGLLTSSGKSPVFVKAPTQMVVSRFGVPTLSGNRRSAHRQGLGFPPLKRLGVRASVRPACRLPLGPLQASCLVIGPDAHVQRSRAEL